MPVYNGESYLVEAVESIRNQTFPDFEFLIIDDGSTDSTWDILKNFNDYRIRLVKNDQNMGITKSLNKGLQLARGNYIARMDADDMCAPERLQCQKEFLDENLNFVMVGSWIEVIDEIGRKIKRITFPIISHLLRWRLLYTNTFVHSAVMFRKNAVIGISGYLDNYRYAEDYDLWSRLSIHWEVANIPIVLVSWRLFEESISVKNAKKQKKATEQIAKRNIGYVIDGDPDEAYFEYLRRLYSTNPAKSMSLADIDNLYRITGELLDCFCQKFNYRNKAITEDIKIEIATHVFSNIFRSQCPIVEKGQLMFCWIKKFKPNIFRIFFIFFFKRTVIGMRIQSLLDKIFEI